MSKKNISKHNAVLFSTIIMPAKVQNERRCPNSKHADLGFENKKTSQQKHTQHKAMTQVEVKIVKRSTKTAKLSQDGNMLVL